jgi:hypothetical protein
MRHCQCRAFDEVASKLAKYEERYVGNRSPLLRLLRVCSFLLPGEYLKTAFYLNCIDRPRRTVRDALFSFYRYDHVYTALREFASSYTGRFRTAA